MNTEQQAALLEEIAQVMRERPEDWWREFEFRCGGWNTAESGTSVLRAVAGGSHVRRRPRTITIAGIEVPEPMREAPTRGTQYHCPDLLMRGLTSWAGWSEAKTDYQSLARGICHYTEEAAQQHARALIIASGGEVE